MAEQAAMAAAAPRRAGLWNVLATAGLVGCIVAICLRMQSVEERLLSLEKKKRRKP